jgi:hypothetical protein
MSHLESALENQAHRALENQAHRALERVLYFDINGTITHLDSTSGDLDPISELNELVSKNFTPTANLVIKPNEQRYYDHFKHDPEKIYDCISCDLKKAAEPYLKDLESIFFNRTEQIFPSFLNLLQKYQDPYKTKLIFRTFGYDGPFILDILKSKDIKRNFISCTYHPSAQVLKMYDHRQKHPTKIIKGDQIITQLIYQNDAQDYLIKDDYKWWTLWNKDPNRGKKIFIPTTNEIKIYCFDDLPNAMDHLTHRVNTILAATQGDYFISLID